MILKNYHVRDDLSMPANLNFMPNNSKFTKKIETLRQLKSWRDSASDFNSKYGNIGVEIHVNILQTVFCDRKSKKHYKKFVVKKVKK